MSTSNATPNYLVTAENAAGLLFKNKRDRKILNVDPKVIVLSDWHVDSFVPANFRSDQIRSFHLFSSALKKANQ